VKDEFNALLPIPQPGYLAEPLGAQVEQYYALEKSIPASGTLGQGEISVWAERLKPTAPDTEVLLTFGDSNGWLDGRPAIVSRAYGRGRITYIGGVLDSSLMQSAAQWMSTSSISPAFGAVPEGIEANRRVGPKGTVYVLINFKAQRQTVALPHVMRSLLDQKETSKLELPQYGVAVLADPGRRDGPK
jgi:beta-galactosidase